MKREQLFRKKDKNYIDTLMKKLKEKNFEGIVLVEFVSGDSEKAFFEDMEKLKRY
jgi:phosphopentomutase